MTSFPSMRLTRTADGTIIMFVPGFGAISGISERDISAKIDRLEALKDAQGCLAKERRS